MKIKSTSIEDVFLITPDIHSDSEVIFMKALIKKNFPH